jgi:hypothetical protein
MKLVLTTLVNQILFAVCYYGYSNYTKSLVGQPRLVERICCMPCWPLVLPPEAGILLLENLCAGNKKLKILDKNKILTYQQVLYY